MVARTKPQSRHVAQDGRLPKYVHHSDFEADASRAFLDGIDALLCGKEPPKPDDEVRLFKAMHYCAFRMRQARGKRLAMTASGRKWGERREAIRDHLIVVNVGLAYEMLRRTRFTNVDEDELLSEGMRALCDAVEVFDPWRGYRFSTYACNAIYRGFARLSKMETRRASVVSFGYDPRMDRCQSHASPADWDERVYAQRLRRIVEDDFAELSERERFIIRRRFPERSDVKRQTLERLGRELDVSKEQVRQVQVSALEKLHARLVAAPVLC